MVSFPWCPIGALTPFRYMIVSAQQDLDQFGHVTRHNDCCWSLLFRISPLCSHRAALASADRDSRHCQVYQHLVKCNVILKCWFHDIIEEIPSGFCNCPLADAKAPPLSPCWSHPISRAQMWKSEVILPMIAQRDRDAPSQLTPGEALLVFW